MAVDYPLPLYRATHPDGRTGILQIRRHPRGPEMQWLVGGSESFARVCLNPRELPEQVATFRADMESHGWTFESLPDPKH